MPVCPYCAERVTRVSGVCPHCQSEMTIPSRPHHADPGQDAGMRMLLPVGRSGWAIAAGYLGLFSVLLIPAPVAIVCSALAISDMKKNPKKHGMGRAVFGLVMGILGTIALAITLVVMAVVR